MKTRHIIPILLALVLAPTLSAWAETISTNTTQTVNQTFNSLSITAKYIIPANVSVFVKGDVTVSGNGELIIEENGSLHVKKDFDAKPATIGGLWGIGGTKYYPTVEVNGILLVENELTSEATFTVNGDLTAGSMDVERNFTMGNDASITVDGKLTGNTNITVNGQLQAGSVENNSPLTINENATMTVSGKLLGDDNITVNGKLQAGSVENNYPLTVNKDATMSVSGELIGDNNITVNGVLEAGSADINKNLTIGNDAMMVVSNLLTNDGDITVNSKLEAGEIIVNKNLTVSSKATLFVNKDETDSNPNGKLTVKSDGTLKLQPESTCIVEGNLKQDGTVSFLKALFTLFDETAEAGDIEASGAMLVIGGDYEIYSTDLLGKSDIDAKYVNPDDNEIYVFGNNELDKVGVSSSNIKSEAEFKKEYGSIGSVLPIELVYFNAHEFGGGVRFEWETASELNNDFFTIEFSIDAVEFAELTIIEGAGTSTEPHNYRYTDFSSHAGIIYYRLKQTDYDGNFSYSETVPVVFAEHHVAETEDIKFVVYPNPATDYITISGGEYESISFVSANGAVLGREAAQGSHDITRLPKGLNFVIIHTANGDASERFIKR
ncbi:MAG: T9SS type A sorting domain-containing protein [Salinivirgaceae bacterium]|nr:T9SS type A sorting domain-containing protein [Salinivirgaceae bacterium]